ncbi:homoserine dehydrogenase [Nocardia sp. NPDC058379]|uniref:homoserine dehydrogenase n=1 Tax=unclassified Nocardia TaxID=2637762 RepID=UPI00364C2252
MVDSTQQPRALGVAVIGMGNVGSQVVRMLQVHGDELRQRIGAPLELRGVAVRNPHHDRGIGPELVTTDAPSLIARPDIDLVVEVMGGIDPARELIAMALTAGKSVVTANKALLADYTSELAQLADRHGADLCFEAAVAGAIPVVRPLIQSLSGDRINRVVGIVNGTTNYLLSAMSESSDRYEDLLAAAQELGYAEADPTADVEGHDAAAKAAILASLAFHTRVTTAQVYRQGMTRLTAEDFAAAAAEDCTIKMLAVCERVDAGPGEPAIADGGKERIAVRVYPALIPRRHPLAAVGGAFNAVVVEADNAGRLMFYGQGAGGAPTASAVMGDLVMAARNKVHGGRAPGESVYAELPVAPIGDIVTRHHLRLTVSDRAGALAAVAGEFARRGVSIASVRQQLDGPHAQLVVLTHHARESVLDQIATSLAALDSVTSVTSVLRLEGTEE